MGKPAIADLARYFLVIPITLAGSAAQHPTDLYAKLTAFHRETYINPEHKNLKWVS